MPNLNEAVGIPDPLLKPNRVSLADNIADMIAKAISTQHLPPGTRIVETALAERLGVSRVPIREALKVLHAQGVLTGGGHRGYHVATYGPSATQQVLEVRMMLERFLLRDAVANWRGGGADVNRLQGPIDEMKRASKVNDAAASLVADLEFHRIIREAADNPIVGTLWDNLSRHVMIVFNFETYRDADLKASAKAHEEFRDLILKQIARPTTSEELNRALDDHIWRVARTKKPAAVVKPTRRAGGSSG